MLLPTSVHVLIAAAGIHGTVRTAEQGAPLAGARIEIDGVPGRSSDSTGWYVITGLAPGSHDLRFAAVGYRARHVTVLLSDASELALDVELTAEPLPLPPIEVVARPRLEATGGVVPSAGFPDADHYRLGVGWQADQQAGSVDIDQAIASIPGIAIRGDNTTALSIRGGRGSENLVLLDGIPVIGAVHFAGASSAINPDAVATVDVQTGVSPARYGDALSGVIELETGDAPPPRAQITGGLSTSDVRSVIRVPLGAEGGLMLGARSSFRNLLTDGSGFGDQNGYQDFIATARTALGKGTLRVVAFESGDHLSWEPFADVSAGADDSPTAGGTTTVSSDAANWRSGVVGATWTLPRGTTGDWHAAAWWTGSSAAISLVTATQAQQLTTSIAETGVSLERRQQFGASTLLVGGQLNQPRASYAITSRQLAQGGGAPSIALTAAPALGALSGDWAWNGSRRVDFRAGLRASTDFRGAAYLDPRLVVNLHTDPVTRIEVGFGRTHQTVQSLLNEENLTSAVAGPTLPVISASGTPVASSDQWEFAVDRKLTRTVTVSLDGYLRQWQHVVVPASSTTGFLVAGAPAYGDGNARGLIASASLVEGALSLKMAAGLARTVQQVDTVLYHTGFEQPWSFSGAAVYRVSRRTTMQLSWTAGAGQPVSAMADGLEWRPYQAATGVGEIEGVVTRVPGPINTLRLAGPARVDLGVRHDWPVNYHDGTRTISTALRLANLFDQANPVGIMAQPDGSLRQLFGTPRELIFEVSWIY